MHIAGERYHVPSTVHRREGHPARGHRLQGHGGLGSGKGLSIRWVQTGRQGWSQSFATWKAFQAQGGASVFSFDRGVPGLLEFFQKQF
jgi:hypothetical protein